MNAALAKNLRPITFTLVWKDPDTVAVTQQGAPAPVNVVIALKRGVNLDHLRFQEAVVVLRCLALRRSWSGSARRIVAYNRELPSIGL